jgi:CheY-like chemotaxis protein
VEDDLVPRRACEVGSDSAATTWSPPPNGAEGLERALQGGYDIVLLDMLMPRMNAPDVLREFRRLAPDDATPVLVLSNSSRTGDIDATAALGVVG